MVRVTGVEPALCEEPDPKSGASANSAIPAYGTRNGTIIAYIPLFVKMRFRLKKFLIFIDKCLKIVYNILTI